MKSLMTNEISQSRQPIELLLQVHTIFTESSTIQCIVNVQHTHYLPPIIIHSHHRHHHSISRLHNRRKSRRGANHPKWQSNISWPEELIDDTPTTEMRLIFDLKHPINPNSTFSPSIPSNVLIWVNNSPSVPPSGAFFISLTRWAMASNGEGWSIDSSSTSTNLCYSFSNGRSCTPSRDEIIESIEGKNLTVSHYWS